MEEDGDPHVPHRAPVPARKKRQVAGKPVQQLFLLLKKGHCHQRLKQLLIAAAGSPAAPAGAADTAANT